VWHSSNPGYVRQASQATPRIESAALNNAHQSESGKNSFLCMPLFVPSGVRGLLRDLTGAPLSVLMAYASHANRDGCAMRELRRRMQFSEGNRKALARRYCPTALRMELAWGRKARESANG
jgi:hypothetical protein